MIDECLAGLTAESVGARLDEHVAKEARVAAERGQLERLDGRARVAVDRLLARSLGAQPTRAVLEVVHAHARLERVRRVDALVGVVLLKVRLHADMLRSSLQLGVYPS